MYQGIRHVNAIAKHYDNTLTTHILHFTLLTTTLLIPNNRTHPILASISSPRRQHQIRDQRSQRARLSIPLHDSNISRRLPGNRRISARLVEREATRVVSIRVGQLLEFQRAFGIDFEDGDGILFFAESGIVAVGGVEEVADDADLGRFDVDVSKGDRWPVVGQGLLEGHGEEGGSGVASRVSNVVDADGAADFVKAVVLVRASNLAEDAVTRAIAGEGDSGGAGGELSGGLVDLEDADQVSAEVRHDKEFAGGVGEHGVRVRLLLSVGARSRLGLSELQSLDGLGCTGDGELVCGECRGGAVLN
jgi:hypothetical protein